MYFTLEDALVFDIEFPDGVHARDASVDALAGSSSLLT
jgi:hypothetical protein